MLYKPVFPEHLPGFGFFNIVFYTCKIRRDSEIYMFWQIFFCLICLSDTVLKQCPLLQFHTTSFLELSHVNPNLPYFTGFF